MSVPPVYFQLISATAGALYADEESPYPVRFGPANSEEGEPAISWFTLTRYGPSNNYQIATYFGRALGAAGNDFARLTVAQNPLIPYTPPTNPFQGIAEASQSWHIMPNSGGFQLVNLTAQKALGVDPQTGRVLFVDLGTQAAIFSIRQAAVGSVLPTVVAKDYFPAGTEAGATLVCSNFGGYCGPFRACINNSGFMENQAVTLSAAVNGANPVLQPSWQLIAENPQVTALTEDSNQQVLYVNAIP